MSAGAPQREGWPAADFAAHHAPGRGRTAHARPHARPRRARRTRPPVVALAVLACALCLSWASVSPPLVATLAPVGADPAARAASALATMQSAYYLAPVQAYAATPGAALPANLWGDSWALAALEDVAALPGGARYLPQVRAATDGLQAYWDAAAQPPAYAPVAGAGPAIVKFYDDNAWVGLDLMSAWRLTGRPVYLQRAEAVMRYAEGGWDHAGGGLWWSDARKYRSAAANAATAELAAELYLGTGNAADLAWAERIYAWTRAHLVTPAGRVADGLAAGAAAPRGTQWTYNYGSVVAAAVALYRATGRHGYLADAQRVAGYALVHLRRADGAWPAPASFDGVLAEGLLALWRVDRRPDLAAALTRNADLAWSRGQTGAGLFGDSFAGQAPAGAVSLLADSGAVRLLAAAAAAHG